MRLLQRRLDRAGRKEPVVEPGPEPRPAPPEDTAPEGVTPDEPAGAATQARRLGEALRAARLAAGLGLEEVEARLRIRTHHLAALEEGRLGDLPPPVYALGFARSYAGLLGLDAEAVARHLRALLGQVPPAPERAFPEAAVPERRGRPAWVAALLGLAVGLGALAGWYALSGADRVAEAPERASPMAAAPPPAPPPAIAATEPPPGAEPPRAAPPPPAPEAAPAPARPAPPRLVIRARAPAWVQVRAGQGGPVLLSRDLQPGESWTAPAREGLLLSTRNAPALEILVDGQPVPGLGSARPVRRDVPLDPERLKAGIMPPAPQ